MNMTAKESKIELKRSRLLHLKNNNRFPLFQHHCDSCLITFVDGIMIIRSAEVVS